MTFLKKMPWGIVAGVAAIIVVFATVAFIALGIILGGVAGQSSEVAGMFVVDIVCGVIMIGSIVLFVLKKLGKFDGKKVTEGKVDGDI